MSSTVFLFNKNKTLLNELNNDLASQGFTVHSVSSFNEAETLSQEIYPQALIIDITNDTEQAEAIDLCSEFRKCKFLEHTMLIVLSPNNEDYIQIECFKTGADDYIIKPIRTKLLARKINALIKRVKNSNEEKLAHIVRLSNKMEINTERYTIEKDNELVFLPRKEFEILLLLTTKPGKVFTREDIVYNVWKKEYKQIGRTIDVHIRKIREKLGDDIIKTVKGIGYKIEENTLP